MTNETLIDAAPLTPDALRIARSSRPRDFFAQGTMLLAALVSVVVSALILWTLFSEAWQFIAEVDWAKTWGQLGWYPRRGIYDIPTIVVGTMIVTAIAIVVAGPLGLGAAIYLSEYAKPRVRSWVKPILEILASIPSVVLGFFALTWIAPNVVNQVGKPALLAVGLAVLAFYAAGAWFLARSWLKRYQNGSSDSLIGFVGSLVSLGAIFLGYLYWLLNLLSNYKPALGGSLAAAGIGVGLLTIPLVASVSEDAMAAVPEHLREASAALGARKMGTVINVVVPAAMSGIVAAFIVATSRALGETMVVFIAGGAADGARFTDSPFDGGLTMTAAMASTAAGTDNLVGEALTVQSLYFVGLLLFAITLALNLVVARFVDQVREHY